LADRILVERVLGGDVDTFGQVVNRYQGLVFGVAYHHFGNAEEARDIAQDVFIRAFMRLDQVRDTASLGSWLRQIAINACRAKTPRLPKHDWIESVDLAVDPIPSIDSKLLVSAALGSIDESSRLTVVLFYLHAYSIKEIGEFLDEPATTIKSRLRNARAKLRRGLEELLERNLNQESLPPEFAERVTRLIQAVKAADESTIRTLLQDDPTLASTTEEPGRHTPLHIAAGSGDTAIVELLLAHGANPNALDEGDNASPLHHAAERGRLDVVKLLVEAGSNIDWDLTVHHASPLGWATMFEPTQRDVAEYLIAQGAKVDIFSAISLGDLPKVRQLVETDPIVLRQRMSRCERFRSPIEFATERRQFEIARLLVELGSEITLSEAAGLGHVDLVSHRLLEKPTKSGIEMALKSAVLAGQVSTARLLLDAGADPNYAPQGTSLIFDSIGANDRTMSELLIEFGADLEFKDPQWHSSALGWQVFYGRVEATQLAIDLGSEVTPNLTELAHSGERGELRRWSTGTPVEFGSVICLLARSRARE